MFLTKCIYLDKDFRSAYQKRAEIYEKLEMLPESISDYQKSIEPWLVQKNTAEDWLKLGQELFASGRWVQSIAYFSNALMLKPNLKTAFAGRAQAYLRLNRYLFALEDFRNSTELWQENSYTSLDWFKKGETEEKQGAFLQAILSFTKAIQQNPDLLLAYQKRGTSYEKIGFFKEAIADFHTVLQLSPNLIKAKTLQNWIQKAENQTKQKQYSEAIVSYTVLLQFKPLF